MRYDCPNKQAGRRSKVEGTKLAHGLHGITQTGTTPGFHFGYDRTDKGMLVMSRRKKPKVFPTKPSVATPAKSTNKKETTMIPQATRKQIKMQVRKRNKRGILWNPNEKKLKITAPTTPPQDEGEIKIAFV